MFAGVLEACLARNEVPQEGQNSAYNALTRIAHGKELKRQSVPAFSPP